MKAVIYLTRDCGKSVLNAKPFKASITHTPSTNKLSVKCKALFKNNVKLASPEFSTKTQNGYILYFNPDTMEQTTFNLEQDRETFEKVVEVNELLKATKYNTEKFDHPPPPSPLRNESVISMPFHFKNSHIAIPAPTATTASSQNAIAIL